MACPSYNRKNCATQDRQHCRELLREVGKKLRELWVHLLESVRSVQISFALASGIVDINNFQFSIKIQRGRALFAIADAGAFDAAKGNMRLAAGGRRIDVRHASLDLIDKAEDAR